MESKIVKISEIGRVEECAGIYGWYIKKRPSSDINEFARIFSSNSLRTVAKAPLEVVYEGELKMSELLFNEVESNGLLAEASILFAPPLYIGITENIRRRLREHRDSLQAALNNNDLHDGTEFGYRIGEVLSESRSISLSSFFVKVLIVEDEASRKDIEDVEHCLNRTFSPIFGVK